MEDDLDFEDIEAAYLRALEAADAVEQHIPGAAADSDQFLDTASPASAESEDRQPDARSSGQVTSPDPCVAEPTLHDRSSPLQVLEALLFVGGHPLPGKKLAELIGSDFGQRTIEELLEELSQQYHQEGRPYEVRLVEGGYELALRSEFEGVRARVFGQGPKDVKLSQDALEVLAFIAYQQPVTMDDIVGTEKKNAPGLVRQLLRRELITLHRSAEPAEQPESPQTYHTTPRFLQLFGLRDLDDLPLAIDFDFK